MHLIRAACSNKISGSVLKVLNCEVNQSTSKLFEIDCTMISHDDDVETLVQVNLLQSVHQLPDDLVYALDGLN